MILYWEQSSGFELAVCSTKGKNLEEIRLLRYSDIQKY